MKNYGSSVLSTENRACIEIANAVRAEVDQRDEVIVFWCNDWIIVDGKVSGEINTGRVWRIVFDYLKNELGYTEDDCKKITVHNKLTLLGKDEK